MESSQGYYKTKKKRNPLLKSFFLFYLFIMFFLFYKQRLLLASVDFSCKSQVCQLHSALWIRNLPVGEDDHLIKKKKLTILLKEAKEEQMANLTKKKTYLNLTSLAYISGGTDCFDT